MFLVRLLSNCNLSEFSNVLYSKIWLLIVRVQIYLRCLHVFFFFFFFNTSCIYTIDTEISFVAEFNLDLISVSNSSALKIAISVSLVVQYYTLKFGCFLSSQSSKALFNYLNRRLEFQCFALYIGKCSGIYLIILRITRSQ